MALSMGTNFAPEVVQEIVSTVKGHSALARLSAQAPVSFSGNDVFVFSLADEANIVAEGGNKTAGASAANPVRITPIKVEYGSRVTDEFMYASEEKQLDILAEFTDGYGKKMARALDIMAMHGLNPRDKTLATTSIGAKSFDTNTAVTKVTYASGSELANLESAVAAIGDFDVTGFALSKDFASKLAQVTVGNTVPFASFMLGANPGTLNGTPCDVNSTVSVAASGGTADQAIVGDFANCFRWGYAKQIPIEVIPYGDPDGNGDLKRTNQVFVRAEAWIGWGILVPAAFAVIQ